MKKLIGLLFYVSIVIFGFSFVFAEDFPYKVEGGVESTTITYGDEITKQTKASSSIFGNLFKYFKLSGKEYDTGTGKALNYVKWILNILLGLVSFISLVLIIFAFYLIFVTKSEEAVGKARKILTGVAIALVILGVSWLITSLLFFLYEKIISS